MVMWQLMRTFRAPILRQFTLSSTQLTSSYVNLRHQEPNSRQFNLNLRHRQSTSIEMT